ncbi:hypothetical protein BH10PSE10_BH10PSE10_12640 [soil metagenome]
MTATKRRRPSRLGGFAASAPQGDGYNRAPDRKTGRPPVASFFRPSPETGEKIGIFGAPLYGPAKNNGMTIDA